MRKAESYYYGSTDEEDYKDWVDCLPSDWELMKLKYDEWTKDMIYDEG